MRGNRYTYLVSKEGGHKLSKIDRVLVNQEFFNHWPLACLRALKREYSDHCPLLLSLNDTNFGPKPFRWFNSWLGREGCEEVIIRALDGCDFHGAPDLVIKSKLRYLKEVLKTWWRDMLKKETGEMGELQEEIEKLERLLEFRDLEEDEYWTVRIRWEWMDSVDGQVLVAMCKEFLRLNRDQVGIRTCNGRAGFQQSEFASLEGPSLLGFLLGMHSFSVEFPFHTMSCPLCEVDDENLKHLSIGVVLLTGV
ncbi:RNA-directed DNA polymerase, eukaryota, Reverse transcriptase zinc-binding domain protein [Artemisia annua]|uniref:RNA-directed DNA polymerase, eukaryota, Reverse transcriptase zinc-binding domain protein n=1 Tax=Artemisia annua TaxID=35608 RepID=A0A2U1KIP5_ARTAN|nr:RNA-directed DNA polymerase, eukaryota, Reverse transcriptase zinc-binding domain protein [Artemisia annua]